MNKIVLANPNVRMDIMVRKEYHAEVVSLMRCFGAAYDREVTTEPGNGTVWVCLKDVRGKGHKLGTMISFIEMLDIQKHADEENREEDNVYILINARKKAKKHVRKNRTKARTGSDNGDQREPAGNPEGGQVG